MPPVTIVIPCYNEAKRLDLEAYVRYLLREPPCRLLLVNDGSTDGTLEILQDLSDCAPDLCQVLPLENNCGKAEAVRQGVLHALRGRPQYVGYWDADLATPLDVIDDFYQQLQRQPELRLIMGARVSLLGRSVQRHPARHYLGRLFAAAASCALRMPVYDTQCGAKLFRVTDTLQRVFTQTFVSQWIFDVEILARLAAEVHTHNQPSLRTTVYEWPLQQWHDVKGSKIRTANFLRAAYDLLSIYRRYRRFLPAGQGGMQICPDAAGAVGPDLPQADTENTEVATRLCRHDIVTHHVEILNQPPPRHFTSQRCRRQRAWITRGFLANAWSNHRRDGCLHKNGKFCRLYRFFRKA